MRSADRILSVLLALAAVVLVVAVSAHRAGTAILRGEGTSWQRAAFALRHHPRPGRFTIAGSVGGLYPGRSEQLRLTVTNPQHFAIVVHSISTTVKAPSRGCVARNLTVASFTGRLRVPARGSAHVSVRVALSHAAPDGCQGAVFPLSYDGLAKRA